MMDDEPILDFESGIDFELKSNREIQKDSHPYGSLLFSIAAVANS